MHEAYYVVLDWTASLDMKIMIKLGIELYFTVAWYAQ